MTERGPKRAEGLSPSWLPFLDIATPDLPLHRLIRLSLFQVSVGMALVLLVGTLNRVMIVELGVPASLVGLMLALPLVVAPFRALIGFRSDTHRCELGWRRVPFIWNGSLLQWGGFAIMPFALLVLAGKGASADAPAWIGQGSAAIAFLLVGAGAHTVQTAGLALATDLTDPESHPKVVGLMYVMLLIGMIGSALIFGWALTDYTPGRLVRVIHGAAAATLVLNAVAMWKQESRLTPGQTREAAQQDPSFSESWAHFCKGERTTRRLAVVGLGTMAFGMADILLEPFGGQVLSLSVSATTRLTAILALGGLFGFAWASYSLGQRRNDPYLAALIGVVVGLPAFGLVMAAAPLQVPPLFLLGNFLIGFGGALFGHATLTATMSRAPAKQAGLAIGAWGAVQATAAGVAVAFSGATRDLVTALMGGAERAIASGYHAVYALEIALLLVTLMVTVPLLRKRRSAAPTAESIGGDRVELAEATSSP
ncbi:MAG: PucC family protein [Pseudomonadota bacterium]